MKTLTRKKAIEKNLDTYYTGKPCKRGHVAKRYVTSRSCIICDKTKERKKVIKPNYEHDFTCPYEIKYWEHYKDTVQTCRLLQRIKEPFKVLHQRIKRRSKYVGIEYNLTPEYLESIWTGKCAISNRTIHMCALRESQEGAQLDRINPNLGYVKGNVQFLQARMNRLKQDVTLEELRMLIHALEKVK